MKKIYFSEYLLFIHTLLGILFSSSPSYVWYLNYYSIFTTVVIFVELFAFRKGSVGKEWVPFFIPLYILGAMALIASALDPITFSWAFRICYAYLVAFLYYVVVVSTGRIWFLTFGLILAMLYLVFTQGFEAVSAAFEFGVRANLQVGEEAKDRLNVNVYALICLCNLAFCTYYAIEGIPLHRSRLVDRGARLGSLTVALVSVHQILIVTGSRKGMIFVLFWMIIIGVLLMRGRFSFERILLSAILASLLSGCAFIALYFSPFFWRLEEIFYSLTGQFSDEESYSARVQFLEIGYFMWLRNPILGDFLSFYKAVGTYTHSNFMDLLVNHGIVGLLVYYSYYLLFWRSVLSHIVFSKIPIIRARGIFIAAFFMMFILWEVAAVNYYSRYSLPIVGVLLGLGVVNLRKQNQLWKSSQFPHPSQVVNSNRQ